MACTLNVYISRYNYDTNRKEMRAYNETKHEIIMIKNVNDDDRNLKAIFDEVVRKQPNLRNIAHEAHRYLVYPVVGNEVDDKRMTKDLQNMTVKRFLEWLDSPQNQLTFALSILYGPLK